MLALLAFERHAGDLRVCINVPPTTARRFLRPLSQGGVGERHQRVAGVPAL